jgi:hypothetical protein
MDYPTKLQFGTLMAESYSDLIRLSEASVDTQITWKLIIAESLQSV